MMLPKRALRGLIMDFFFRWCVCVRVCALAPSPFFFQDEQYSELDKQLKLVEELRFENKAKERELAANIRKQQEARFRNLQQSVAQGIVDEDA